MANANRPTGLTPVKHLSGAPYNGAGNIYSIAAAYNVALYQGDPVISSGTADTNGVAGIVLAAATGPIRGVIMAIGKDPNDFINPGNLDITYRPAAAQTDVWYALVADDPDIIFEVQEIGTGTQLAATDVGLNTNLVLGTGNGFVSGWLLDNGTEAVTATLQCRLLGLARRADNAFGAYAKWLVKINAHELGSNTAGL
jgi:hypothetical protein